MEIVDFFFLRRVFCIDFLKDIPLQTFQLDSLVGEGESEGVPVHQQVPNGSQGLHRQQGQVSTSKAQRNVFEDVED